MVDSIAPAMDFSSWAFASNAMYANLSLFDLNLLFFKITDMYMRDGMKGKNIISIKIMMIR